MITLHTPKLLQKKLLFFSSNIRMSGNSANFGDKKVKKVDFTKAEKKSRWMKLMLIKY